MGGASQDPGAHAVENPVKSYRCTFERRGKEGARGRRKEGFATMEEETAFPDSSDFEFFMLSLPGKPRLPDKFAELLDGREPREVKLREASGGRRLWDVELVFDGDGHMYLGRGWDQFAGEYGLQPGHFLVFSYDGGAVLTVKVFDGTMCRRHYHYQHDDDDDDDDDSTTPVPRSSLVTINEEEFSISSGSKSNSDSGSSKNTLDAGGKNIIDTGSSAEMDIDYAATSQFSVMLRACHLGVKQKQYLNVPVSFQIAHGYNERSEVVLRMRGKKWTVKLKHNTRAGGKTRASLRYGWRQFCVDNGLGVGDTCFFRALRGSDAADHELKVEARKRDGTFLD